MLAVCLLPLPRKVDCKEEMLVIEGVYLDFLLLCDRFFGKAIIEGSEYEPFSDYSASKVPADSGDCYMINLCRYQDDTNALDLKSIYLKESLKELAYELEETRNDAEVAVIENETMTELYELKTYATVYEHENWMSAQGLSASTELSNIADELPKIVWNEHTQFDVSEDVEVSYIRIFDKNFERMAHYQTVEELQTFCNEAEMGLYYIVIAVNKNGRYILEEEKYEQSGSEFVFGLIKE